MLYIQVHLWKEAIVEKYDTKNTSTINARHSSPPIKGGNMENVNNSTLNARISSPPMKGGIKEKK